MAKVEPSSPEEKKKMNRREFLNFAWLASLGFLMVNTAGMTYLFAMPRFKEGEFGGVFTIGNASELPEAGSAPVNYPKVKLWLSNTDQGVMALYKVCTHLGCLYNWNDQEDKFICPCHGSEFEENGEYLAGPAPRSLDRFVVQLVDPDTDQIIRESEEGSPLPVDNPNAIIKVDTGRRIQGRSKG